MKYNKSKSETIATTEPYKPKGWSTKNIIQVRKNKELGGKILPYMVEEEIDNAVTMAQYRPSDFSLENLIEIGADKLMTEASVQPSTLMLIDHMNKGAEQQMAKEDALAWYEQKFNESIKQNKKED